KRELIAKVIKAKPELSDRQVATKTGTSHPFVGKVRTELEEKGDVETVSTSLDTLGREQPRAKAKPAASCVALGLKVTGADKELAQWLLDHPQYSDSVVADWLGCDKTRINDLRKWATEGFRGSPSKERAARRDARTPQDEMPTEEEADESWQNDLYDQACLLLERMAEATRQ